MSKQTAIANINKLIQQDREEGTTRKKHSSLDTIDELLEEERRKKEEQERRNAASAGEVMDMVRSYGDYTAQRRQAEAAPTVTRSAQTSGGLTPALEAEYQKRNGINRAPTAYQTYMMQFANSAPETRSTEELRRDMNRQNRLAAGMDRMAADAAQDIQNRLYDPTYTANLQNIGNLRDQQTSRAAAATELYQALSTQRREQEERDRYAALMQNPDFAAKSQGDAAIGNKVSATALTPAERLYQDIYHRDQRSSDAKSNDAARYVSDEEAGTFFYLWNTQGPKAATAYYQGFVENRAGQRRAEEAQAQAARYGAYDPVGASIASVGYNVMSGVGLVDMALQNLTRAVGITDRNKPLNYNSDLQLPGQVTDALRQGVADYLEELYPNAKIGNSVNVASFLYQTGMSMADSSVAIVLNMMGVPEPLTLAGMGSAAGTRAIREAKERGATDGQALAFGISSAVMEALFEKVSLDQILKESNALNVRRSIKNVLQQGFTEGSEEVATTLANTLADQLIMGDKSELFTMQRQLMEQGVSEKEALGAAFKQWGTGILGDAIGGFISGVGMGGPKEIYNAATNPLYGVNERTARMIDQIMEGGAPQQEAAPAAATPPLPQQSAQGNTVTPPTPPVPQSAAQRPTEEGLRLTPELSSGYNSLTQRGDVAWGENDTTWTEGNRPVQFTYAVVPLDSLIISNDQYGGVNENYPAELQPRDRQRATSQGQVQNMANSLVPQKLAASATAQNGAPLIRGDGVVIGGNGRTAALSLAYEKGLAGDYEKFLRENGSRYGVDADKLPNNPVLVRVVNGDEDWLSLAQELNVSSTAAYSATETAQTDATKIGDVLALLVPNDDGDINTAANQDFIQAFVNRVVPANERGRMQTPAGLLSQDGLDRAINAIFAYAYGDTKLLTQFSEDLDPDTKNVINALAQSAPAVASLQNAIKDGSAYDIPARDTLLEALSIYRDARQEGKSVSEYLQQGDMLRQGNTEAADIARFIEQNKSSAKQLRFLFSALMQEVLDYGSPDQGSMFGGEDHDIQTALNGAVRRYEELSGKHLQRRSPEKPGGEQAASGGGGGAQQTESHPADGGNRAGDEEDAGTGGARLPGAVRGEVAPQEEDAPLSLPTEEAATPIPAEQGLKLSADIAKEENRNGQGTKSQPPLPGRNGERSFRERAEAAARKNDGRNEGRDAGLAERIAAWAEKRGWKQQGRNAAAIRAAAALRGLTETSGAEQGIEGTSDARTAALIPESMLTKAQAQAVRDMAADGVELHFMIGQFQDAEGGAPIRALVTEDGKKMYVQADHKYLTWRQLMDHEELHRRVKEDPEYRRAVENELLNDKNVAPYLRDILDRYARAYAQYGITDENEVTEELLADYRAGFDMLEVGRDSTGNSIRVRRAAAADIRSVEKARSPEGRRDSGVGSNRYSREISQNEVKKSPASFGITRLNDFIHVQNQVFNTLKEEGYLDENGRKEVVNAESGKRIEINKRGIFETFGNGNRYQNLPRALKELKLATVRLLPDMLENGRVESPDTENKHKANSSLTYSYIRSAVKIGDETYPVTIDIRQSPQKNMFWVHSIRTDEIQPLLARSEDSDSETIIERLDSEQDDTTSSEKVKAQKSREIDAEYKAAAEAGDMETAQRMVYEAAKKAGYTVRKYHQTDVPNIHVFDIGIGAHGGTDSETPYGVFTKNTRSDIGLGEIQMSLYLKPGKTFVIKDRSELRSRMPEAYNLLATKLEAIDEKYDALAQEAEDALFDAQDAYEAKHPEAEVTLEDIANNRTYDDPACQRANENWKAVMADWNAEADKIRVQAKEVLSKYLRDSGYDSMEIKLDKGTNGRSTDTFIVFSPDQVKSADPVTYDDDGNIIPLSERFNPENNDIRYSREIDPEVAALYKPESIEAQRGRRGGGKRKVSRVRSNTYDASGLFNEVEAQMDEADEQNYTYDPISEKRSLNEARGRLRSDFDGEVSKLSQENYDWGGSDLDTAMGILHQYRTEGRQTGDYSAFWNWSKTIQEKGTRGGQFVQAFAKYTRTGTGQAQKAAEDLRKQFALNPAQEQQVKKTGERVRKAVDDSTQDAADDALKQAKGRKQSSRKADTRESQRRKDAERLVREIYEQFNRRQRDHGEPVENWLNQTGEELARKIAGRFSEPKSRTRTTMQTILSDLVGFAQEHALPERQKAEGQRRTAIDTITDYLSNRDAYGTAWAQAQAVLRAQYAEDQEKLDALEGFLGATIGYNAEGTDRTMLDAILQSADVLGISERRILELASAGATASTIDRIGDELVSQVRERMGADYEEIFTGQLKDAVRRHVTGIALQESAEDQRLRLGRLERDAARNLDIQLQKLLTESKLTKQDAARRVADYLIRELDIPAADAAIAAQRIGESFMDELADRADKRLQNMFAEKSPRTKEQRDKLLDLLRLGGFTNANVEDAVVDALGIGKLSREEQRRITADMARFGETLDAMQEDDLEGLRQLIREQAAVRGTKLSRMSEKVLAGETDAEYLRDFAMAQLASIAGDFAPRNAGAKISTFQTVSHLLNMRTALRNFTSNQVFDLVDSAANNLAVIPDIVIGAMTGKRTVGVNKSWLSEMKRAGAKQGAGRNALEVNLDVSPDDRQKSKYGTAGRRTNSMADSNAFGRILSHLEEVMGYELNTTDEFHKGSVRGETLESLARLVERGDMTQEEANAFAEEEALYRSFQDDTLAGNLMGEAKRLLNMIGFGDSGKTTSRGKPIHDFGLGDLVVKYTQVPGALIHRGIEYSPLGYAKMIYDLALAKDSLVRTKHRGENTNAAQRRLALDIGRATTGSGLIALFATLALAGLLRRDDDDKDKNAKAMHAAQGLSGTQLNVTALGRWIEGEDAQPKDGDVLADIGFLEPLDSLMTIATLLARDKDLSISDVGVKSLDGIWKAISNTSAMQTISNIISTVQYHDEENDLPLYFQIPIEIASDSVSGFVPSPVRQLAQATDTTYRDQYRSKSLNDQVRAKVMNSVPGVRQMLAPKITPLGEDKKYQKPLLNYLNATLNPGNINVYQASDVVDELNRVYGETDDTKIWPERNAPYSITVDEEKYTLTPDERTQYQRTRGQTTANAIEAVMGTDWYKTLDASSQAEVMNWIGNFANFIAKKEMLDARGQDYGSKTYDKYFSSWVNGTPIEDVVAEKYGNLVQAAEETAAAETIIAEAKIPEASKAEAETMSAEAKRYYAGFLKGGVSDETARKLATELEGSETSGHEQWRKVYDSAGKEGEKAVTSVMTDDMKRNWNLAKDAGVSMDDYIKVRENFKDLNGNGNKSQDEWNATLDSFTFSTNAAKDKSIKGTLWQILTGSGSTKNNPYDKEAGQKVIDAKSSGGGSGSGSYAPLRLPTLRQPWEISRDEEEPGLTLAPLEKEEPRERRSSGLKLSAVDGKRPRPSGLTLPAD